MSPTDHAGMDLRGYLSVLRRRKWVVILSVLVATTTAVALSLLRTPIYEATARVLLEPTQSPFDVAQAQYVDAARVDTEIQVIESEPVRAEVRKKVGGAPAVSATQVGASAVIEVKATDPVPTRAAAIANAYAESYINYRRQKRVDNLVAAAEQIQGKIEVIQGQINESDAAAALRPNTQAAPNAERDALINLRAEFRQRLDELEVDRDLKTGGAEIALPASVPSSPTGPSAVTHGLLGFGVGLIFGIAAAFALEQLDDSVKGKEDLERSARDLPVLGVIPVVGGWKNRKETRLVSSNEPSSQASEAYRTLRTSIQFMGLDRPLQTLLVTSPGASEGKTTTLANLAVALARAGQQVVVVSCDLRRPRIHEFFGLPNSIGFTSVLLGDTPLSSALLEVPGEPRLRLLPTGPLPPNPSELLSSQRAAEVLATVALQADMVLLDCPPVLPVTDAALLSTRSDGVLVVAMAGETSGKGTTRTVELLHQVGAPLIGTVLNGASIESAYGYSYYYYYSQSEEPNGKKPPKKQSQPIAKD